MSIPVIESYRLPTEASAAVPRPPRLDPDRAAVLVHDMQEFFVRPFEGRSQHAVLVRRAARVLDAARAAGLPVVYTAQPGDMTATERGLLQHFWGPGMSSRPHDRGFVPEVAPRDGDTVLTKWRYSAFHATDLLERLQADGRDQLLIVGVYAHLGVMISAVDAMSHGVMPFVVADAVADFGPDEHQFCLDYVALRCGVVTTVEQVVSDVAVRAARQEVTSRG